MALKDEYLRYLDHFGEVTTVARFAAAADRADAVALRHDVDHDLDMALEMGWWEQRRGVSATYYLLDTADYWSAPDLLAKCRQLADFGHELGLHVNTLARWIAGTAADVRDDLGASLERLRGAGIPVRTVSAHGDPLCYSRQFINYWAFSELRPADPRATESGRNAEGVAAHGGRFRIDYPTGGVLRRDDGAEFPFWSVSMAGLGLEAEAMHVPFDSYFSDSGGTWSRSPDPLGVDLRRGRHQVLMHPEHWRGPQRIWFFLSAPRSGSQWLSETLRRGTLLESRHEFLINHRYDGRELRAEKRTLEHTGDLLAAPETAHAMLLEGRDWIQDQERDYAEANPYLHHFPAEVRRVFPDARLVHLHRDPRDVVRSLMNRDWYDTPEDSRHPPVSVPDWDALDQFGRVCAFVRDTDERLESLCGARVALGDLARDDSSLAGALAALGIPWFPRLAAARPEPSRNASRRHDFPDYAHWTAEQQARFEAGCADLRRRLGYGNGDVTVQPASAPVSVHSETAATLCNIDYQAPPGPLGPKRMALRIAEALAALRRTFVSRLRRAPVADYRLLLPGADALVRIGATRCAIGHGAAGLDFVPVPEANASLVIGGGLWKNIDARAGWPARIGHWYRGTAKFALEGDTKLSLYCLMYDAAGRQFEQRHLANFDAEFPGRRFAFRPRPATARFALGLLHRAAPAAGHFRLLRFQLEQVGP